VAFLDWIKLLPNSLR